MALKIHTFQSYGIMINPHFFKYIESDDVVSDRQYGSFRTRKYYSQKGSSNLYDNLIGPRLRQYGKFSAKLKGNSFYP